MANYDSLEAAKRAHIHNLLDSYVKRHLAIDHIAWSEQFVLDLFESCLQPIPTHDPTSLSLPTPETDDTQLEALFHQFKITEHLQSSKMNTFFSILGVDKCSFATKDIVEHIGKMLRDVISTKTMMKGDGVWERVWFGEKNYEKFDTDLWRPMSPLLSRRAIRETPIPGSGRLMQAFKDANAAYSAFDRSGFAKEEGNKSKNKTIGKKGIKHLQAERSTQYPPLLRVLPISNITTPLPTSYQTVHTTLALNQLTFPTAVITQSRALIKDAIGPLFKPCPHPEQIDKAGRKWFLPHDDEGYSPAGWTGPAGQEDMFIPLFARKNEPRGGRGSSYTANTLPNSSTATQPAAASSTRAFISDQKLLPNDLRALSSVLERVPTPPLERKEETEQYMANMRAVDEVGMFGWQVLTSSPSSSQTPSLTSSQDSANQVDQLDPAEFVWRSPSQVVRTSSPDTEPLPGLDLDGEEGRMKEKEKVMKKGMTKMMKKGMKKEKKTWLEGGDEKMEQVLIPRRHMPGNPALKPKLIGEEQTLADFLKPRVKPVLEIVNSASVVELVREKGEEADVEEENVDVSVACQFSTASVAAGAEGEEDQQRQESDPLVHLDLDSAIERIYADPGASALCAQARFGVGAKVEDEDKNQPLSVEGMIMDDRLGLKFTSHEDGDSGGMQVIEFMPLINLPPPTSRSDREGDSTASTIPKSLKDLISPRRDRNAVSKNAKGPYHHPPASKMDKGFLKKVSIQALNLELSWVPFKDALPSILGLEKSDLGLLEEAEAERLTESATAEAFPLHQSASGGETTLSTLAERVWAEAPCEYPVGNHDVGVSGGGMMEMLVPRRQKTLQQQREREREQGSSPRVDAGASLPSQVEEGSDKENVPSGSPSSPSRLALRRWNQNKRLQQQPAELDEDEALEDHQYPGARKKPRLDDNASHTNEWAYEDDSGVFFLSIPGRAPPAHEDQDVLIGSSQLLVPYLNSPVEEDADGLMLDELIRVEKLGVGSSQGMLSSPRLSSLPLLTEASRDVDGAFSEGKEVGNMELEVGFDRDDIDESGETGWFGTFEVEHQLWPQDYDGQGLGSGTISPPFIHKHEPRYIHRDQDEAYFHTQPDDASISSAMDHDATDDRFQYNVPLQAESGRNGYSVTMTPESELINNITSPVGNDGLRALLTNQNFVESLTRDRTFTNNKTIPENFKRLTASTILPHAPFPRASAVSAAANNATQLDAKTEAYVNTLTHFEPLDIKAFAALRARHLPSPPPIPISPSSPHLDEQAQAPPSSPRTIPADIFDKNTLPQFPPGSDPYSERSWTAPEYAHIYLATVQLIQKRALVKALQSPHLANVQLAERPDMSLGGDSDIDSNGIADRPVEADLVLDPYSCVVFAHLMSLPSWYDRLAERLTKLSWRYNHILVVFEAYTEVQSCRPSASHSLSADALVLATCSSDILKLFAYGPPVVKAVKKLRRILNIREGQETKAASCQVKWAFANNVEEAAMFARIWGDLTERRDREEPEGAAGALWDGREEWIDDFTEGEQELSSIDGMNAFAARVILCQMPLQEVLDMYPEERIARFGRFIGDDRLALFNEIVARRSAEMEMEIVEEEVKEQAVYYDHAELGMDRASCSWS